MEEIRKSADVWFRSIAAIPPNDRYDGAMQPGRLGP